jgi:hypothetical protein
MDTFGEPPPLSANNPGLATSRDDKDYSLFYFVVYFNAGDTVESMTTLVQSKTKPLVERNAAGQLVSAKKNANELIIMAQILDGCVSGNPLRRSVTVKFASHIALSTVMNSIFPDHTVMYWTGNVTNTGVDKYESSIIFFVPGYPFQVGVFKKLTSSSLQPVPITPMQARTALYEGPPVMQHEAFHILHPLPPALHSNTPSTSEELLMQHPLLMQLPPAPIVTLQAPICKEKSNIVSMKRKCDIDADVPSLREPEPHLLLMQTRSDLDELTRLRARPNPEPPATSAKCMRSCIYEKPVPVTVQKAGSRGKGLFIVDACKKNQFIVTMVNVVIINSDQEATLTGPAFKITPHDSFVNCITNIAWVMNVSLARKHPSNVSNESLWYYMNHAFPSEKECNVDMCFQGEPGQRKPIWKANRVINAGEELCYNYGGVSVGHVWKKC